MSYAILAELERALRSARRERCTVAAEHQAAMELYLDTWVVRPLERAIAEIRRPPSSESE
jgi:hypothetical protein